MKTLALTVIFCFIYSAHASIRNLHEMGRSGLGMAIPQEEVVAIEHLDLGIIEGDELLYYNLENFGVSGLFHFSQGDPVETVLLENGAVISQNEIGKFYRDETNGGGPGG